MTRQVLSERIGTLASWQPHPHGLTGHTTYGIFRVTIYTPGVIRIAATREETFDDFSYAVVARPQESIATIEEQHNVIIVKTPLITLSIEKNPVRFVFATHQGDILNEDDPMGISWNGEQVTNYKKLQPGERFIGLGEKTGPLDRRGQGYQNWNTDSFGYSLSEDPLYCSIPFYIGIHNQQVYGVFFDNSFKSFFNFGASNDRFSSFAADAGDMNYYFIHGATVTDIIQQYTHLTGRTEIPPLWSLGYQQCRYSYYPDKEVLNIARTFREKDIPCDTIVLDIHYMDDYKIFTWSKKHFPDPKGLIDELHHQGFQVVVICDPGIKIEQGYHAYDDGIQKDVFLKYPDGSNYTGNVWPGWCHFPDFTKSTVREWWQEQLRVYTDLGITGFWNDMNEIATWGNMVPENIEFDFDGEKGTMRKGRNIYGFQMSRSSYEGAKTLLNGSRPFNLTRAGFAGVQRYGAVWTGDNVSYDDHMMLGVRMINSMGLSGIAFAGYDIGGFVGEANARLFSRWISIGAFSPFFRGHTMINSGDSEPWSYGEEAEQIARNYIKFRYQMMPYIYSLFYEAFETGMPVQRSLAIDFTHDHKIYDGQFYNQYLFGPYILVCPVESDKKFVKVYFPEGEWYSLYDGRRFEGHQEVILECPLHKLPVFVKAGAILPLHQPLHNTRIRQEELNLHLYGGGRYSHLTYYEDDGTTFGYQQNHFHKRKIEYIAAEQKLILHDAEGDYTSSVKRINLIFHALHHSTATVNGDSYPLTPYVNQFFSGLEKHDPFYDPEPAPTEHVLMLTLDYSNDRMELTLH